jgi:hypothetical protein
MGNLTQEIIDVEKVVADLKSPQIQIENLQEDESISSKQISKICDKIVHEFQVRKAKKYLNK